MRLDDRVVPSVYEGTFTLTDANSGQTATVEVTVNEAAGGLFDWHYHLVNDAVDYSYGGPTPIGIGLFGIAAYPGVIVPSSVDGPDGWNVYVGDTGNDPGVLRWFTSDETDTVLPGEYADFSFQAIPVAVELGGAEISDPWYASGGGGLAAVPGAPVTVDLNLAGLADDVENVSPGRKIHINDNFDEQQIKSIPQDGLPGVFLASDNATLSGSGAGIVEADADLANASLSLGPVNALGTLTWTIGSGVKVWWKGADNKWVEVSNQATFTAPAQPIDLKVEGITLGGGSVKAQFTVAGQSADDQVQYTVYTGLKLTGTTALTDQFQGQIAASSTWTLTRNANGEVWRTEGRSDDGIPSWQVTARGYFESIFKNEAQTSITVVSDAGVVFDQFSTNRVDPKDIAKAFDFNPRFGGAIVTHVMVEQYEKQAHGISDYADAHSRARVAEAAVFVGSGTRGESYDTTRNPQVWVFTYDGGVSVELLIDTTLAVNPVSIRWR